MSRRLILIRHGQTTYNASGRMQGHLDTELSDVGYEQARAAARYREIGASLRTAEGAALWQAYLQDWTRWNHVRTLASLAASAALGWAVWRLPAA